MNLKSTKNMDRRFYRSYRRGIDVRTRYVKPIVEDAFEFGGPEISKRREKEYYKKIA